MSRRPDMSCAGCGKPMWSGNGSLPQGLARCQPCRRLNPSPKTANRYHRSPCIDCASPSYGVRCRSCADRAKIVRALDDPRVHRKFRERDAPGLRAHQRSALLARWRAQGRACIYCRLQPATTVDHVLPLVRGGTNYEGNLAPCCKPCNSSKAGLTVAEWRTGRRLPRCATQPNWASRARQKKPLEWAEPAPLFHLEQCEYCADEFMSLRAKRYCSDLCTERSRRVAMGAVLAGTQVSCGECRAAFVIAPRKKCGDCLRAARRVKKKRYLKTPAGKAERRRHEQRRSARRREQGAGGVRTAS